MPLSMQGSMNETIERRSIIEIVNEKYTTRPPIKELTNHKKINPPKSLDTFIDRVKFNGEKFIFYYVSLLLAIDFLFVLLHKLFIIPIAISLGFLYLSLNSITIKGIEISPLYSAIGCILTNFGLCIFLKDMSNMYVYFFALNAAVLLLIIVHGSLMDISETENEDEPEAI